MTPLTKVTLKGGLKAGDFTDVGKVGKLEDCYQICCKSEKCNLAFMLGQNCFSVKCYNDDLCKTIPAQPSIFNPQIAYIANREKVTFKTALQDKLQGNDVQTVTHVTCPKGHVVDKVTLAGGLNAGRYRDHGKVQNITQCRRICCEIPQCNVAFMIAENCFTVECTTEAGCRTQPALTSPYHPRISYVRFIGSPNIIGVYDDLNSSVKNSTKSLDDLFKSGSAMQQANQQPKPNDLKQLSTTLEKVPQMPPGAGKTIKKKPNDIVSPAKSNLLINGETKDLASALQNANSKPHTNHTALKGQLDNVKAGQALSLQVVNGELKLTATQKQNNNDQTTANPASVTQTSSSTPKADQKPNGRPNTQGKKSSCKAVQRMNDVTLSGGKSAGKFTEHGATDSMDTCLDYCCKNKKCNLVLMLGKACYTVECKDKKSCRTSPAPPSEFSPQLAVVRPVKEKNMIKIKRPQIPEMPKSLKCNYKQITNDKKLSIARKAGTFKLAEGVTSMSECMEKCCEESMCDLVYLEKGKCFTVTCNSPDSCATRNVGENEESPLMAFTSPVETVKEQEPEVSMEEHETTPTRVRHCKPSKITRNSKLKGAKLTDMGTVDDLQACITHCCSKDSCDVAYMEEQKCYTVQCQDGVQCKTFREPASKDENILIAYMQRSVEDAEKEKDWVIVYVIVGSLVCASGLSGIIWASCICIKRNRLRNNRRLIDDADEEEEEEMIPKQYSRYNNPVPRRYR